MSESSGDTPEWLRQHKETPSKIFLATSSDDDDDLPLARRHAPVAGKVETEDGAGPSASQQNTQQTQADGPTPCQMPGQHGVAAPAVLTATPVPALKAAGAAPQYAKPEPTPLDLSQQPVPPSGPKSAARKPPQPNLAGGQAGGPSIAAHLGVTEAGKLPIMLPEKLNRNKALLELPPAPAAGELHHCHGAADLSGDSGAVGRIVVVGAGPGVKGAAAAAAAGGSEGGGGLQLQVDLKGVIYNAWVLPLAATAMVLNIGPTEAKVESLFNDFVRLREAADQCGGDADGGDAGLAYLLDGDDENYQLGGSVEGDGAPVPAGKKGAGKKGAGKKSTKQAADKGTSGAEKKAKAGKTAATKADKKGGDGAKKKSAAAAAYKKVKPKAEPKKTAKPKEKKAQAAKPAGEGAKKTTARQGLGVKAGGVTKKAGAARGATAAAKKQTTLTSLAAGAVKPKGGK